MTYSISKLRSSWWRLFAEFIPRQEERKPSRIRQAPPSSTAAAINQGVRNTIPCAEAVCAASLIERMKAGYLDRITSEPGKCGGRPCIRGLRMRVKDVLELLAAGASHEEILAD